MGSNPIALTIEIKHLRKSCDWLLPRKRDWEAHGKQERRYILEARRCVGYMGASLGAEKRAATSESYESRGREFESLQARH
jgi:hypothetical protein